MKKITAEKSVKKIKRQKLLPAIIPETPAEIMASLILDGNLSQMTAEQRVTYALHVGKSLGLNMATKPFDVINLSGKVVLYANKNCAEQLRKLYGVSVIDQKTQQHGDIFITIVQVQDKQGRTDTGTGAVNIKGLSGDALANAVMKSETKAKRRGTLSLCGLGMLDETEIETIPNAQRIEFDYESPNKKETEKKKQEIIDKVGALPDYIKDGFKILGYTQNTAFTFAERFGWDEKKIKFEIDKIIAAKEGVK